MDFRRVFFSLALALTLTSSSQASLSSQEEQAAFNLSNNAIGKKLGDYSLIDQDGKKFGLREFAAGKPLIVSLIYTSCGHICPTITMSMKNAVLQAGKDFGAKFNAITIGFDVENDTPQRMKQYGENFADDFKRWKFAAADKETIERLTKDFGFYYKKASDGFDHLNVITIVDAKGKIYKQIYGFDFKPEEILGPVYQAMSGKPAPKDSSPLEKTGILDRLILFCYKYDKATGKYKLDYPFLIGTAMEAIVILTIIFFVWGRNIKSFFARRFGCGVEIKAKEI